MKWSRLQAPPAEGNPRHEDERLESTERLASCEDFSETFGEVVAKTKTQGAGAAIHGS
ncbi:hypothetical protein CMUS01_06870 [Colletotrichum musicola]|uniref:Uncharacterized protein n=1 Tax=Colletotrichum musicola TaxID=2175873 RepID=A0A8H6KJ87_9PEZI|nr:hypothetical protein CMUS01_06870 [Colletotrichum musicola]